MLKIISLNGKDEVVNINTSGLTQIVLEIPEVNVSKKLDVIMEQEGAEVEVLGVYIGAQDQTLDYVINTIHKVPHTKCLTQIRGVLKDSSVSTFKGMIKIEKQAQQTNSYLDDDVLILGDKARNQSEPTLEIEANDVKATHGATTGRIPLDHIFYLQSRGLTQEQAEKMIVEGFLQPVISRIQDETLREEFFKQVLERLN